MVYRRRHLDDELDELLPALSAIALDGPKGVGKSETARQRAATILDLDDDRVADVVRADPHGILERDRPVVVDEWQRVPATWDVIRRAVDLAAPAGSFLMTGSVTPGEAPVHSGAGRIVSLRMRPMTLVERGLTQPTVSLAALLEPGPAPVAGDSPLRLEHYAAEIERSGFPGIRDLTERARRLQLEGYITRALARDLEDQGITLRRPESMRAWLRAYALATGTTMSWEQVRRSATPGDADPPTKVTTLRYRDWLTSLWLLDPLPAWLPSGLGLGPLSQGPKHHLCDPALAAATARVTAKTMLLPTPTTQLTMGALFESLATLCVRTLAQTCEAAAYHLRTGRGEREVDLIVEGPDGRVVALEVKLSGTVGDHDVRHLHWLRGKLGDVVSDLVVLTTGPSAYRRPDGVAVVPLALLTT